MIKVFRFLFRLPLLRQIPGFTKKVSLPGFKQLPLYDVLDFFAQQADKIGFSERAATIAFNTIMALPGALIFLVTLVPFLPDTLHFHDELMITINDVFKNQGVKNLVSGIITDFFDRPRSGLLWFSIVFVIFFSSNAVMGIMRTFDRSYFEERSSRFLAKRWTAFKLTALLMFMVIICISLLAMQGTIKTFVLEQLGWNNEVVRKIIEYSRWLVITALLYSTIAVIYHFGPALKQRWGIISPGAVIATIMVLLITWLFSLWFNNFSNINKLYGSIGTVIVLLNLIYINALILLVGFEINVSITAIKAQSDKRRAMEQVQQAAANR